MTGFHHGDVVAYVCSWAKAQGACQTGSRVGKDIAVLVSCNNNVEMLGVANGVARRIDHHVVGQYIGVLLGHLVEAAKEEPVSHTEYVGLVEACHTLAAMLACILE